MLQRRHGELFVQLLPVRPLPGPVELLRFLRRPDCWHCHVRSTPSDRRFAGGSLGAGLRRSWFNAGKWPGKPERCSWLAGRGWEWKWKIATWWAMRWDLLAARRAGDVEYRFAERRVRRRRVESSRGVRVYRDPAELRRSLDELGILPTKRARLFE